MAFLSTFDSEYANIWLARPWDKEGVQLQRKNQYKEGAMSRPRSRIMWSVNVVAKIQDKGEYQHQIQLIQDRECYQCQGQDSGQGGLSMTRLRFRIRRSTNVKAKIRDKEGCQ